MTEAVLHFRASPEIGGGHAMRCATLAHALDLAGWTTYCAVTEATRRAAGRFLEGTRCAMLAEDNSVCVAETIARGRSIAVIDDYAFTEADEQTLYQVGARALCVIDDLAARSHRCDVLIDQTMGRSPEAYDRLVPKDCILLLGVEYALLRDEFSRQRQARSRSPNREAPTRVFASFGALDAADASSLLLRALDEIEDRRLTVDLVLSGAAPHLERVLTAAVQSRHQIAVHVDPPAMADLMVAADLAVGGGGGMAWERCALGLPTLLVQVAENQASSSRALADAGAARHLGRFEDLSEATLAKALRDLLADPRALAEMSRKAARLCDGRGTRRVVNVLNDLFGGASAKTA